MKGTEAKQAITKKILENFDGSFIYGGKEIRVPFTESGERVEIKVTLTCAKTNVGGDLPSAFGNEESNAGVAPSASQATSAPTEEEKANIAALMSKLGI